MKNGVPTFVTLYKYCGGGAVGSTQSITLTVHGSSGTGRSRTGVSAFYMRILLTYSMQHSGVPRIFFRGGFNKFS